MTDSKRMVGTVSRFSYKGYGWVVVPTFPSFYLHTSQIKDHIHPAVGQTVSFIPGPPTHGVSAEALDVEVLPITTQDRIENETQDQVVNEE
jgi:hypothetical protein